MPVTDVTRVYGVIGAVRDVQQVRIGGAAHADPRGFVFQAVTAGDYHVTPEASEFSLTLTLAAGEAPTVAGLPIICTEVSGAVNATILVGNF